MKKLFKEFGDFIARGNVLNLAVGIIIGAAFNAIVTSLVNDLIMPPVSLLLGNEISLLKTVIQPEVLDSVTGEVIKGEIALKWGNFLQAIMNFLLVALSLFIIIKVVASLNARVEALKKVGTHEEEVMEEAPVVEEIVIEPSEEVLLLREIRDSLTKK